MALSYEFLWGVCIRELVILYSLMQLSMHKRVQYDSVKGEIEVALYAALEGASKIHSVGST